MSKQSNTNFSNTRKVPFCKVCVDAGKTDTAHFPRQTPDINSPVVCPTLLALECRYCFKNGHTVKYCSVLKNKNKDDDRARDRLARTNTIKPEVKPISKISNNRYAGLDDDSDDEFVPLASITSVTPVTPLATSWASVALKAAPIIAPIIKPIINNNNNNNNNNSRWADDDDDESVESFDEPSTNLPSTITPAHITLSPDLYTAYLTTKYDADDDAW